MSERMSMQRLTAALMTQGFISVDSADAPAAGMSGTQRPWFISVVLGLSGWLAGLFGLMFVGMLFSPSSTMEFLVIGIVLLAAAYGLYAVDRESAFFDQLALALSIAGQLAMTLAAWEATNSASGTVALVAIMQCILVIAMPNRLAKLLASFFACLAWALAVRFSWWGEKFLDGGNRDVELVPALIGWFVIWIPVIIFVHVLILKEAQWMSNGLHRIARPALSGLLLGLSIGTWVSEPFGSLAFWSPSREGHVNWLSVWPLLAASAALFAGSCAFRLRNRGLVGIAIVGAFLHIVQFYFLLGTTLLLKSFIMLTVGAAALAAAEYFRRKELERVS